MKRLIVVLLLIALSMVLSQGGMMQQPMNSGQMMGQMMGPMMQGQTMMGQIMGQGMFADSFHEELAALLGVTSDELFSLRQGSKTLAAIVEELGGKLESITTELVQNRNNRIDQALKSGTVTQAQAEQMKDRSDIVVTAMLNRNVGFGFSNMNMMGTMPCPYHGHMMMLGR
jgi:hypothetical protein